MFSGHDKSGNIVIQQNKVREIIQTWYPLGSSASDLMRFFGSVIIKSQDSEDPDIKKLVQKHCLHMPSNKVFTQKTIVCTYGYTMPPVPPAVPGASILWIMSISYNRNEQLTAIEIHARKTSEKLAPATTTRRGGR